MASRLSNLPAELVLLILQHLNSLDVGSLVMAEYSTLTRWRIVAGIPLLEALNCGNSAKVRELLPATQSGASCSQGFPIPLELWLHMDGYLSRDDKVNLAMAMWPILALRWNVGFQS